MIHTTQTWEIGDCVELMQEYPNNHFDIILTDPPYNLGKDYGDTTDDNKDWDDFIIWLKEVFTECYRVLKDPGVLYVSVSQQMLLEMKPLLEDIGYTWRQFLIWNGPNIINVHGHADWKYTFEPIIYVTNGNYRTTKGIFPDVDVFRIPRPQTNFKDGRDHPTQKPVGLYVSILKRSPGDLVLDPFLGSGATLRACRETDKNGVGFEINPDYEWMIRKWCMSDTPPLTSYFDDSVL